jgi:hypothetical protein
MPPWFRSLVRTKEFAITGVVGFVASVQFLQHYSPLTDRSNGFAYWGGWFCVFFAASYVVVFAVMKFKDYLHNKTKKEMDNER